MLPCHQNASFRSLVSTAFDKLNRSGTCARLTAICLVTIAALGGGWSAAAAQTAHFAGAQSVIANAANGLFYPEGVAVDGSGNVYIADLDNARVLK